VAEGERLVDQLATDGTGRTEDDELPWLVSWNVNGFDMPVELAQ
jgi:predicted PolB exonuclease-like 3'-5' exonuclease